MFYDKIIPLSISPLKWEKMLCFLSRGCWRDTARGSFAISVISWAGVGLVGLRMSLMQPAWAPCQNVIPMQTAASTCAILSTRKSKPAVSSSLPGPTHTARLCYWLLITCSPFPHRLELPIVCLITPYYLWSGQSRALLCYLVAKPHLLQREVWTPFKFVLSSVLSLSPTVP